MNPTENVLVGIILGLIIPKRLIHEWSVLMRLSLGRWSRRHRFGLIIVGIIVGVLLLCSAFIVVGFKLATASQNSGDSQTQSDCNSAYLNGSAPLAQAKDDALQAVLDDVAAGRTAGAASHKEVVKFYRDLAAEQAAYHALKEYRDTHVPKEACP